MLGAGRPQEGYDFFNAIPPRVPDLRKFPTYRPCTFPMAAKRHPNKTGSFCTLGILIFPGFATSRQIGSVKQNENDEVTQTSERTTKP